MPTNQTDPVADLLAKAPTSNAVRAAAWDAYESAANEDDLAAKLQTLQMPDAVKAQLWDLKVKSAPVTTSAQTQPTATITPSTKEAPEQPGLLARAAGVLGDVATGVAKGAGQTAVNAGRLVQMVPGVTTAVDALYGTPGLSQAAMSEADRVLTPTNTAQKVGKVGEQIAEVVLPGQLITKAGTALATQVAPRVAGVIGQTAAQLAPRVAVEAVGGAGLAALQGGDLRIGATVSGALPVIGAAARAAAPVLKTQAVEKVVQALGPTKERFKAMAEKIAPDVIRRGLGGSREALQAQASEMVESVGGQIDDAIQQYGARQVGTQPIVDALEQSKSAFQTVGANGQTVILEPRAVKQLTGLQQIITKLGPEPRVDQLIAVRRAWDKVVADAGGFAHRAPGAIGVPLKDQSEAWAKREATTAIRRLLDTEVPELATINKEFAFWKNLDDVLTQTLKRTQPQGPGVGRLIAEGAGQIVGGTAGSAGGAVGTVGGAVALGKVAKMAQAVFTSPRWRLADAKLKDKLAEAITHDKVGSIATLLGRISAAQGSQVPGAASRQ